MKNDKEVTTITWDNFSCKKCKALLPLWIQLDSKNICLVEYKPPSEGPYMVLETLARADASRAVFIFAPGSDKSEIVIGKGS